VPGPSTLTYLLSDHLNSTVATTTTASEAVDRMQYYPFGSIRSGGVATDRTYTGQQTEAGSALKLSYYHARFYSAELGHFVSADPTSGGGLNRYAYVLSNPLRLVDPSGLDGVILCGTTEKCESGDTDTLDSFKAWVVGYWQNHEHIFGGSEDYAFAILEIVLQNGWGTNRTLDAFHVGFIDTIQTLGEFADLAWKDNVPHFGHNYDALEHWENVFWRVRGDSQRPIDTLIGFSAGASVAERILEDAPSRGYSPETAILIQPADVLGGGSTFGFGTSLRATSLPDTRIITINDPDSAVKGMVSGAINIWTTGDCGSMWSHCSDSQVAPVVMRAAQLSPDVARLILTGKSAAGG
jgi:RHS repeat-associated protein